MKTYQVLDHTLAVMGWTVLVMLPLAGLAACWERYDWARRFRDSCWLARRWLLRAWHARPRRYVPARSSEAYRPLQLYWFEIAAFIFVLTLIIWSLT